MSVTRTYTVTVVSTDSGNKYFIDGVQQDTLNLAEGGTFKFDQADSSNGSHPLRFSTTSDGTHNSGSQYTTGVTTSGIPGSSGAYTQIEVAASAPTLYYYCSNHSGMGGQANTISGDSYGAFGWSSNSWGISSLTVGWGVDAFNDSASTWGDVGDEIVSLTGISATFNVGSITPADVIGLTGVSSTSSVGSVSFTIDATAAVTGVSSTSSVGSLLPADVMGLTGVSSTSSVGSVSVADVIGLTGVSATFNVGSISIGSSPVVNLTGQAITVSGGSIDPLAIAQGLTGQSITSAVGSVTVADLVLGISGVEATASVATFGTATGFGIQSYSDVDTGSNSSYTNVATGSNTSYSDAA